MERVKNSADYGRRANRPPRRKGAGFTLLEIAVVLGITGLALGGVWVAYSQVRGVGQIRAANQQLAAIAQNVRALFTEQPGVMGRRANLTPALDRLRAFPLEMRQNAANPAGIVFNPWNQQVNAGLGTALVFASDCAGIEAASDTAASPCFSTSFLNVPQAACIRLLAQSPQVGTGLQGVLVNASGLINIPVTVATAAGSCSAASNQIVWVYLLKDNPS